MRSSMKRLVPAHLLLVAGLFLTSCGGEQEPVPPPGAMVLIAGAREGVPSIVDESGGSPELLISSLREQLKGRFDRDMNVSVIPPDGNPGVAHKDDYKLDIANGVLREESPERRVEELSADLAADARASTGESDLLAALDLGGRQAAGSENKVLYVFDSGVSTAGALAMQNGLLGTGTEVSTIVEQLQAAGNMPHLEGVEVRWWGLGQVASPQGAPPVWAKTKLQELWTAVIEAAGGSVVFHHDAVKAVPPTGKLPEVTPVDFENVAAKPVSVSIPESQVSFHANSAVFADAVAAETVLGDVASSLDTSAVAELWITGCTARPDGASAEKMIELSEQRASTVVEALKETGLTTRFHARGLGPDCPGQVAETGDEVQAEAARAKNRRVLITSKELHPADSRS